MIVRRVVPKDQHNTRIKRRIKAATHRVERKSKAYLREIEENRSSSHDQG